jgi:hypothetical protein
MRVFKLCSAAPAEEDRRAVPRPEACDGATFAHRPQTVGVFIVKHFREDGSGCPFAGEACGANVEPV